MLCLRNPCENTFSKLPIFKIIKKNVRNMLGYSMQHTRKHFFYIYIYIYIYLSHCIERFSWFPYRLHNCIILREDCKHLVQVDNIKNELENHINRTIIRNFHWINYPGPVTFWHLTIFSSRQATFSPEFFDKALWQETCTPSPVNLMEKYHVGKSITNRILAYDG